MRKVLVSVAPVSAVDTEADPKRIADDVIACAKAGAAMAHLHVRGRDGRLTSDLTAFKETLQLIRKECDIVIQASTGGVSELTIVERCKPLSVAEVECASLNVGSVNLGRSAYINKPDDVEYCVKQILQNGKVPEVEVFEIGMIHTALYLSRKFGIPQPLLFGIVLGHNGAAPASIEALTALRSFIPEDALWGITHYGRRENDIIAAAISMGASTLRIGFEDSGVIDGQRPAQSNVEIVRHFVQLLHAMGKQATTPAEARILLKIN